MKTTHTIAAVLLTLAGLTAPVLAQGTTPTAPATIDNTDVKAKPTPTAEPVAPKTTLTVGDKAPALVVEKFLKGEPVTVFTPGKVYVVEFWATWCGPCIAAFPHLSKLQAEYKDKGVTFIGVNVWERPYNEGTLDKVAAFVEKQGERMAYTVAFDGKEAKTNKAWMEAAGQNGIPHAFIVNQDGIIAWMGHPMGMDEPLSKIVAKSWKIEDAMADAAERQEYEKNAKANEAKIAPINKRINDAIKAKNWDDAMTAMDELKALMPAQMAGRVELSRFNLLLTRANQPERAYAMKETLLATKGVGDNAQILNDIAWRVLDDEKVITRNFDFALELATKANELSGGKDGMILDTLARAHFEKGNKAQAIELQEKALQLAKASAEADPETIAELEANLKRYKGN